MKVCRGSRPVANHGPEQRIDDGNPFHVSNHPEQGDEHGN